jgi:hypothetical protein
LGDALIAKTGATGSLLTIYAASPHLINFGVGCHSQTYAGVVLSGVIAGRADSLQADHCTGSGIIITPVVGAYSYGGAGLGTVVTPVAGTSTTLTSQLNTSGTSFTVAATALQGQTLGGTNCSGVMLSYGTAQQEALAISGVSIILHSIGGSPSPMEVGALISW